MSEATNFKPTSAPIRNALICVSDKTGLIEFTHELQKRSIRILSIGGTAKFLRESGITISEITDYTGFKEIMGGRVKTLHPLIHGGILARRGQDEEVMQEHGIIPIDLVVVNFYPFEAVVSNPEVTLPDAIDNIDVGGPAMIRAAAKNYKHVTVAVDKEDYDLVQVSMNNNAGAVDEETRYALAIKAFEYMANYDGIIANFLGRLNPQNNPQSIDEFPAVLNRRWYYRQGMRYGENPHQKSAFYVEKSIPSGSISSAKQLQGKKLSYNNIVDTDTAIECVRQFDEAPACVIVKHANPCGVAISDKLADAYDKAYSTDAESAFGGIIAFNRELDEETSKEILKRQFVEVIVAPSISEPAREVLASKETIRVLACGQWPLDSDYMIYKQVSGGMLVQEADSQLFNELKVVTKRNPSTREMADLQFAWQVARMVKSNAIVYARDKMTIGIGAGQMSRITSSRVAGIKARQAGLNIKGAVMASDAFFPFRDSIDNAASEGITAVVQPGGSVRDDEVIEASNRHGMAMVFTGIRHFRH